MFYLQTNKRKWNLLNIYLVTILVSFLTCNYCILTLAVHIIQEKKTLNV